jgi:hypothetical protein
MQLYHNGFEVINGIVHQHFCRLSATVQFGRYFEEIYGLQIQGIRMKANVGNDFGKWRLTAGLVALSESKVVLLATTCIIAQHILLS